MNHNNVQCLSNGNRFELLLWHIVYRAASELDQAKGHKRQLICVLNTQNNWLSGYGGWRRSVPESLASGCPGIVG